MIRLIQEEDSGVTDANCSIFAANTTMNPLICVTRYLGFTEYSRNQINHLNYENRNEI